MAGHVISGDTPKATAVRELKEEIGLITQSKNLRFLEIYIRNAAVNKAFIYIYVVRTNMKIKDFTIQKEELTDLKFVNINTLIRKIKKGDKSLVFANDQLHIDMFTLVRDFTI